MPMSEVMSCLVSVGYILDISLLSTLPLPPMTSSQGRTNLPPDKVPWSALRTLLSQCIYGGRIDNDFDQRLLNSFVNRLFTVKSFNSEFPLMQGIDGDPNKNIIIPEGIR